MKILAFTGVLALIFFALSVSAQNWDDEKTFWTKNSIRNMNKRLDSFESRLAKAERPRRSGVPSRGDGNESIRPRRPLTLYERTLDLYTIQRQLEHINEHHNRMFHIWLGQLEVVNGKTEALEEANQ